MGRRKQMEASDRNDRRLSHCTVHRAPLSHFFKIILASTVEQKKLCIPYKFVQRFGDELTDIADFIVPNGSVWKVGLSREQNSIWFDDGWQNFAEHHSICNGHFLVFAYTGFCIFNVFIFDRTASEIEYPCNNEGPSYNENSVTRNEVEMQDDNPSEMLNSIILSPSSSSLKSQKPVASGNKRDSGERHSKREQKLQMKRSGGAASMMSPNFKHLEIRNKRLKVDQLVEVIDIDDNERRNKKLEKGKHKILRLDEPSANGQKRGRTKCRSGEKDLAAECEDKEIEIITSRRFKLTEATPESESAICAARMYMPKNPSCMILLTAYSCHGSKLYVPRRFTRYLNKAPSLIKLQVSDGREWDVHLAGERYKHQNIGGGWSSFCMDNDLNEGDVCVFELVKNKEVLKVSIFRATKRDSSETHTKLEQKLRMRRSNDAASMVSPDMEHLYTRNKRSNTKHLVQIIDIGDNEKGRKKLRKHINSELDEQENSRIKCRFGETKSLAECEDKEIDITTSRKFECIKATTQSEKAMAAARMYMPKNPYFIVSLSAYNIQYNRLYVPISLSKYLRESPSCIKLQVCDGREWEVHLREGGYNRRDIGVGWNTFRRENNLDKGDVCVFELMKNKEVLKVSIFRAIEDGRHES